MMKKNPTESDQKEIAELRKKVQVGALLVSRLGLSGAKAARLIGVPKSSFNRYLAKGLPDGPILPEGVGPDLSVENQFNQIAETLKKQSESANSWTGRDEQGKYLSGHPPESTNRFVLESRRMLEEFTPYVTKKFIRAFEALPDTDAQLILAYSKELFDRVLGKPRQSVDINADSNQSWEEYGWLEEAIRTGDFRTIELANELSQRVEKLAGNYGGSPFPRQVEIVPPPEPVEPAAGSSSDREVSETDNQHAASARKMS
ncbi:MAG: hypothetical protein WB392_03680 [Methanotrichaceae archaeon]